MAPEPKDNPNANTAPRPNSPFLVDDDHVFDSPYDYHPEDDYLEGEPYLSNDEEDYDSEIEFSEPYLDDYCTHGTPIGVCDYDHDKELNDHDEHDDYNYYDEEIDGLPPRFISREERLANDKEYWE